MARQPRGRDWQERAHEDAEFKRRDRASGVAPDVPNPFKLNTDLPRRPTWRWTAIGVVVLVAAVLIRNNINSRAPSLTTSCTTPAMALSTTSTHKGAIIRWSATGPASTRFVIFIGTGSLVPGAKPGQLHPVPDPGGTAATTEGAVLPTLMSSKCTASGAFSIGVPAGHYNVRMFRLTGTRTDIVSTVVATKQLAVSS